MTDHPTPTPPGRVVRDPAYTLPPEGSRLRVYQIDSTVIYSGPAIKVRSIDNDPDGCGSGPQEHWYDPIEYRRAVKAGSIARPGFGEIVIRQVGDSGDQWRAHWEKYPEIAATGSDPNEAVDRLHVATQGV